MNILKKNLFMILPLICLLCTIICPAYALKEALGPDGINAYAVHQQGITGTGVNIGCLSVGNARDSHTAFERQSGSAVKLYDFTDTGLSRSPHDTHMAGIIVSNGTPTHPDQIGVAPGARLHSARFSNKQLYPSKVAQTLDTLIKKHNCRIIMTGIQLPKEIVIADGTSNWTKMYDYYAETYDVFFACAAGNSSPQITVFGDIYNGITTAGMVKSDPNGVCDKIGSISNHGPAADGRKKPEVSAPTQDLTVPTSSGDDQWKTLDPGGRGLTSYAVPHTAGVASLLLEAAAKSPIENDDKTEVIKAVIVNATDPVGSDTAASWKPDSGYGKLNALRAYETLMAAPMVQNIVSRQNKGWAYGVMASNDVQTYPVQCSKGQRLIVTVTWHRKIKKLNNIYFDNSNGFSIDLKITSPSGKLIGFETAGRNNLIKADYRLEEEGPYKIILKNAAFVENHDYAIAFELTNTPAPSL